MAYIAHEARWSLAALMSLTERSQDSWFLVFLEEKRLPKHPLAFWQQDLGASPLTETPDANVSIFLDTETSYLESSLLNCPETDLETFSLLEADSIRGSLKLSRLAVLV